MAEVLILDDDRNFSEKLTQAISGLGHVVHSVDRLEEALRAAGQVNFDVVFVDSELPELSGPEVFSQLLSGPNKPELIVFSDNPSPDEAELAIRSGAWDYLQRPDSPPGPDPAADPGPGIPGQKDRRPVQRGVETNLQIRRGQRFDPVHETLPGNRRPGFPKRSPGSDIGGNRDRQGSLRFGHPRTRLPGPKKFRGGRLRGPAGQPGRKHPVRPQERGLHRSRPGSGRSDQTGRRRHPVSGRSGGTALGRPGVFSARIGRKVVPAGGRRPRAHQRFPAHFRHQPRPGRNGRPGRIPAGPALPPPGFHHHPAGPARPPDRSR